MSIVATTRARNKIKHFIHGEEKLRAVELGRKLIEKEVRRFALKAKAVLDAKAVETVCGDFNASKPDDLYAAVGYGKVAARAVLDRLVPENRLQQPNPETPIASVVRRILGRIRTPSRCVASTI